MPRPEHFETQPQTVQQALVVQQNLMASEQVLAVPPSALGVGTADGRIADTSGRETGAAARAMAGRVPGESQTPPFYPSKVRCTTRCHLLDDRSQSGSQSDPGPRQLSRNDPHWPLPPPATSGPRAGKMAYRNLPCDASPPAPSPLPSTSAACLGLCCSTSPRPRPSVSPRCHRASAKGRASGCGMDPTFYKTEQT